MIEFLQDKMVPLAYKLDQNRYISAIKAGFFGAMSILILGSIFLLLANLPIPGYPELMASILGENWTNYFMVPYQMTMDIMTPFVMIGMAKSLALYYKVDDLGAIILSLVGFLIMTPLVTTEAGVNGIPTGNLSASGLFLGMITAVLATEIFRAVIQKGWVIKMPESVPSNVARSFTSLIPGLFILVIFNFIRIGFSLTNFETAHAFIFEILQRPLLALGATLPAMLIILVIEGILWSFGIHGSNIIGGVMNPIWLSLTVENAEAFAAGTTIPNIINTQFYGNFVKLGGAGATIGLAIACLLFAKSQQYKTLGKLSLGPAIFNINEPLTFGIPIVLNPIMMIPFIIAPLIMAIATFFLMELGIVSIANGTNIPWTTPPVFSGLLISGWTGAVWQVVQIGISFVIYYPFFKIQDRKAFLIETQGAEEQEKQATNAPGAGAVGQ